MYISSGTVVAVILRVTSERSHPSFQQPPATSVITTHNASQPCRADSSRHAERKQANLNGNLTVRMFKNTQTLAGFVTARGTAGASGPFCYDMSQI